MALRVLPAIVLLLCAGICFAGSDEPTTNWWSFKQPVKPIVPEGGAWVRNPIDRFIAATHARHGLQPAPEADRRTLLRRVTFNLTGLPPTPEELRAFLNDKSADAYEDVVDRLLSSPRHGERWARHWLDTVHYGESHGYDKDKPRLNAWPYRDYVIGSFNSDKPYPKFVEEQLAADLLSPEQPESIAALGFIAAGPWDFVGHVELPITKMDGLMARYNDRDDMVMNTMSTFQSLTVHCARCHDHKFDPISQRDYYGLQAVFAGVDRADRKFDIDASVTTQRRQWNAELQRLTSSRRALEQKVAELGGEALRALEEQIKASTNVNKAAFGYHSQIAMDQQTEKWVQVDLGEDKEIREIVYVGCHDDFNNIGAGFGFPPRFKLEVGTDPAFRQGSAAIVDKTKSDVANPGVTPQRVRVTGKSARYVRFTATKLAPRKDDFIFALAELMVFDGTGRNIAAGARVTALDSIQAPPRWHKGNLTDGNFTGATNGLNGSLAELSVKRADLMRTRVPQAVRDELASVMTQAEEVKSKLLSLPPQKVVYAATDDFPPSGSFIPPKGPRTVHFLRRGEVKRPGDEMKPTALASLSGMQGDLAIESLDEEAQRRAALARWITHTNNMLTRRSIVNRVWAYHFGRGMVDTQNDFGRMGGEPSHPELLDWLAFWFMENGESLKKLHRLIVTSATYRQASQTANSFADSQNRYLWRMNRTRLDAEQFRDAVLSASGKLDLTMGGPSVQQFAFKDDHSPVYDYGRFDLDGPGANRRSIYRFIVRSVPDPFMEALDCPDSNVLTPTRTVTTTALQALATWNDAFVLRQCDHLAARAARDARGVEAQVARCFELILLRAPSADELAKFTAHAKKHGMPAACRVLLNSNEFMFIE